MPAGLPEQDAPLLAVLSNGSRHGNPLTPDDERLLDDWLAGRLTDDRAAAAATLVRRNVLAAEHVLERRLLALAAQGPEIPPAVAARLGFARPPTGPPTGPPPGPRPLRLSSARSWRWPLIAGGLVLATILAVASVPVMRQAWRSDPPLQVAQVTIADRGALFEPTDSRRRGGERNSGERNSGERGSGAIDERRFRDIEIPAGLLKSLFGEGAQPSATVARDVQALLPVGPRRAPTRVLVDAALRAEADAAAADQLLAVRLYDLADPRAADLRAAAGVAAATDAPLYLVTVRR